jgi:hypothetical protein
MFGNSLQSKWLLLAGLTLLATGAVVAQTPTVPALSVTELDPSLDDWGSFGPPTGFGAAVGISGTTAVVGVPLYDLLDPTDTFTIQQGRVAVFTQDSGGVWTRTASLVPTDRQPNEQTFGNSLALANNILIVGSGSAVRIFVNKAGAWTQTATLPQAPVPVGFNGLTSPSIAFDGQHFVFVANAPGQGGSASGASQLLLYVYSVDASGHPELLGTLSPPDLSAPGIALVNGILAVKGLDSSGNGLVYVYSVNSATPTVPQVLTSGESVPDSSFGSSIAIWNQRILVGAPGGHVQPNDNTGGSFSGAAYVFAPGAHGWVQTQKIVPNDSGGFGTSVALTQAGALICAPYSDDRLATILGNTEIYTWQGNQLVFAQSFGPGRPPTGTSMALSDSAAIIGTWQMIEPYGSYEYADIVTLVPAGGTTR